MSSDSYSLLISYNESDKRQLYIAVYSGGWGTQWPAMHSLLTLAQDSLASAVRVLKLLHLMFHVVVLAPDVLPPLTLTCYIIALGLQ